jgi:hypothetical protein
MGIAVAFVGSAGSSWVVFAVSIPSAVLRMFVKRAGRDGAGFGGW